MSLNFKIARLVVGIKRKGKVKRYNMAIKACNKEQLKIFTRVIDIAKKNREAILFDPYDTKILVDMPKISIIMKDEEVKVMNETRFHSERFNPLTFAVMTEIMYKEAHKVRRRIEHEANIRFNSSLDKVLEGH